MTAAAEARVGEIERAVLDSSAGGQTTVDERLEELKARLVSATTLDDYQEVGRRAREVLIAVAREVFDPAWSSVISRNDSKGRGIGRIGTSRAASAHSAPSRVRARVRCVLGDGDVALATDIFDDNFTTDLVIARFTPGGSPETTFGGGDGWRTFDVGTIDVATTIAPLAKGGLVVGGFVGSDPFGDGPPTDALLVALRSDGQLWRAFGDDGVVRTDFGARGDVAVADAVIHDGTLVVVGHARRDMMVARFELKRSTRSGTR